MTQASCKTTINIPSDAFWQVISDFSAADKYLLRVNTCTVEGEGVGALRTLTSTDESMVVERLETLDGDARQLSYTLLSDTPFRICVTTIAVLDLGPTQAEVTWSAFFEPDGIPAGEAK